MARSPEPVHFYHAYADSVAFPGIVREHFAWLKESEFEGRVFLGITGSAPGRRVLTEFATAQWPELEVAAEAETGFEDVTIAALHKYVMTCDPATPVLYCHAKGSANNIPGREKWRQAMTSAVVGRWKNCVALLEGGYDAVGLHWLTPEQFPGTVYKPFFGGNFWWARAGFLATLPPVEEVCQDHVARKGPEDYRFGAESWIGYGPERPLVYDPNPGNPWPAY